MQRAPVNSSNLETIGYHPESQTLEVEFRHGGVYQYFNVPMHRFVGLMTAESKGRFFDQFIKKAGYSYRKVWEFD
ncbi:KTSC domain-containing protein [Verrucomicrobiota bacterium sgz303538]